MNFDEQCIDDGMDVSQRNIAILYEALILVIIVLLYRSLKSIYVLHILGHTQSINYIVNIAISLTLSICCYYLKNLSSLYTQKISEVFYIDGFQIIVGQISSLWISKISAKYIQKSIHMLLCKVFYVLTKYIIAIFYLTIEPFLIYQLIKYCEASPPNVKWATLTMQATNLIIFSYTLYQYIVDFMIPFRQDSFKQYLIIFLVGLSTSFRILWGLLNRVKSEIEPDMKENAYGWLFFLLFFNLFTDILLCMIIIYYFKPEYQLTYSELSSESLIRSSGKDISLM